MCFSTAGKSVRRSLLCTKNSKSLCSKSSLVDSLRSLRMTKFFGDLRVHSKDDTEHNQDA